VDLGPHTVLVGRSYNDYAACMISAKKRRLTILDRAGFLSGIALAAGAALWTGTPRAVWDGGLTYLEIATGMGLVMAEA
jgi:hypothetical protein